MSLWPRYYILSDRLPVAVDLMTWARWFETNYDKRQIGQDRVGRSMVSTVFLGIDHNFCGDGNPILFETMIFGGPMSGDQWRWASYDDAERGHAEIVAAVRIATAKIKSIADKAGVKP